MANLVDYISGKILPYSRYIIFFMLFLIFISLGIYGLIQFVNRKVDESQKFNDSANIGNNGNPIEVMMFHVDWCPYCKKALPEWQPFCDQYNNKLINGYTIKCDRNGTNCTDDMDPVIKNIIDKYNIQSYPTIVLIKEGKRYDYDARVTKSALEQFIQSVTSN